MLYNPQLETFLCVVESGSFSKAAEKLFITAPAVIKQINFTPNAVILRPMSHDQQYRPIIMKKDFPVFGKVIDVIKNSLEGEELVYENI